MKHGDIIVVWERVFFIYEADIAGGFLKAVDYSTSTYLNSGRFAIDQMYHNSCCRNATQDETSAYWSFAQKSKYFKKQILEMELI